LIDQEGTRLAHHKLDCELKTIVQVLAPYKERLENAAVESTYNWYWLVDGLKALGYPVLLANPANNKVHPLPFGKFRKGRGLE